jgi:hypothetical protein
VPWNYKPADRRIKEQREGDEVSTGIKKLKTDEPATGHNLANLWTEFGTENFPNNIHT